MSKSSIPYLALLISLLIHSPILFIDDEVKINDIDFSLSQKKPQVLVTLINDQKKEESKTIDKEGIKKKLANKKRTITDKIIKKKMSHTTKTVDFQTIIKKYIAPVYPKTSIRKGEQGTTIIKLTINDQGIVTLVELISSSQSKSLDQSAISAAKLWTFNNKNQIQIQKRIIFKID